MDGSDPASYAASVLQDRLDGATPPHLLLPVAIADDVVPPATGRALARALGLPHVAPVVEPVALVAPVMPAPASENIDGRTQGFFQFDRVTDGDVVELARHANTPLSPEATEVWSTFLGDWAQGRPPIIVDPYMELGTPPLADDGG